MVKKILSLLLVGLFMAQCTKTDDRVLGTIDGKPITVSQFIAYSAPSQSVNELLDSVTADQLNSQFEQYSIMMAFAKKGDDDKFFNQESIKTQLDKGTEDIYNSYYQEFYNDKVIAPKLKSISVSDKDLNAYKKRVQVRHILFSNKGKGADPEYVKKTTEMILNEVKSGKQTFGDLAEKYSDDPGSAQSKGLIETWINETSPFVEPFKKAALQGKKGDIIPDVVSVFGTHIIMVEDVQERSIKELKEQEPNLVENVKKEKENEIINGINDKLLEQYKDKIIVHPQNDLFGLIKAHKANKDKVVLEIKDIKIVTVEDIFNLIFKDEASLQQAIQTISKQKFDVNEQLNQIVSQSLPVHYIYIQEAKNLGADKDPQFLEKIEYQKNMLKGNLYLMDFTSKLPKPKAPSLVVTAKDITDFYNSNKETYFTQKDKDGNAKVLPLDESLKKQIESFLKSSKQQAFEQESQTQIYDAIKKEAQPFFEQFGIKLTPIADKAEKK